RGGMMDPAVAPDRGPAIDHHVRSDPGAVPDLHMGADHCARSDRHAGTELGGGVDERGGMDRGAHRSTTVASRSASATRWFSTYASPCIFEVPPLSLSSLTLKWSWSPGVTGRRKRALSMPMKYMSLSFGSSTELSSSRPPTCAIASMISTAGMIGWPGKWPWKNGSLTVTFLMPSIDSPSSMRVMRSNRR